MRLVHFTTTLMHSTAVITVPAFVLAARGPARTSWSNTGGPEGRPGGYLDLPGGGGPSSLPPADPGNEP